MKFTRQSRFDHKMREREIALRSETARTETTQPTPTQEQETSPTRNGMVCDYCKCEFHSYGQLLNHRCEGDT